MFTDTMSKESKSSPKVLLALETNDTLFFEGEVEEYIEVSASLLRKIDWHLMPPLFVTRVFPLPVVILTEDQNHHVYASIPGQINPWLCCRLQPPSRDAPCWHSIFLAGRHILLGVPDLGVSCKHLASTFPNCQAFVHHGTSTTSHATA